ncbi:hypothetical protein SprV_0200877100 [Sparganum proliferum]
MTSRAAARDKFYEDLHALLATVLKADRLIVLEPAHLDQHLLPPSDARDGHRDASSVATLAPAGLCPRPEARSAGRAGDKDDPGCRRVDRPSPCHLRDVDSSTASQETSRLASLPVAAPPHPDDNASVENRWCQLRHTVQPTSLAVLGRARRQHQDWSGDNNVVISNLLAEKNHLHKAYVDCSTDDNRATFYLIRRLLQRRLREMQEAWTARKVEETQGAVLNRPSTISDVGTARLPQVETNADLGLAPSLHEAIKAVQRLSSGKAPGPDAIPAEIYKHGGSQLMDHLMTLFRMWRRQQLLAHSEATDNY